MMGPNTLAATNIESESGGGSGSPSFAADALRGAAHNAVRKVANTRTARWLFFVLAASGGVLGAGCGAANSNRSGTGSGAYGKQATAAAVLNNAYVGYRVTCPNGDGLPVISDSSVRPGVASISNGGDLKSMGALMCMRPDGTYGGAPELTRLGPDEALNDPNAGLLGAFCVSATGTGGSKPEIRATVVPSPTPEDMPTLLSLQASCGNDDQSGVTPDMTYNSPAAAKEIFAGI